MYSYGTICGEFAPLVRNRGPITYVCFRETYIVPVFYSVHVFIFSLDHDELVSDCKITFHAVHMYCISYNGLFTFRSVLFLISKIAHVYQVISYIVVAHGVAVIRMNCPDTSHGVHISDTGTIQCCKLVTVCP